MTAAGRLRHRLVLEQAVAADDGAGGSTMTWTVAATVWGSLEALAGREGFEAEAVVGLRRARIVLRHRDGVGPAMRLRLGARLFEIEAVRDADGSRRFLVCDCVERGLA